MTRLRHLVAVLALAVLIGGAVGAPAPATGAANALSLRTGIVVDGPEITFGDLFEGAGVRAATPISRAPLPGGRVMLRASSVAALARRNGLVWRPPTGVTRIVVARASRIIPRREILERLAQALEDEADTGRVEVQVATRRLELHVAPDADPTVAVETLSYDPRSRRFSALLRAPANDPTAPRVRISGRAFPVVELPVLRRRVPPGEVISADDVKWLQMRASKARRGIITEAAALIGKTPRRELAPGRPIRANEVQRLVLVAKGATVTMSLATARLRLSALGRALEAGAEGDMIRVINLRSHRTIEGQVVGPNRVVVPFGPRLVAEAARPGQPQPRTTQRGAR